MGIVEVMRGLRVMILWCRVNRWDLEGEGIRETGGHFREGNKEKDREHNALVVRWYTILERPESHEILYLAGWVMLLIKRGCFWKCLSLCMLLLKNHENLRSC
jgi:hypothetical protein